eukprot:1140688-Pelagomonas_calceolata.AAC.1
MIPRQGYIDLASIACKRRSTPSLKETSLNEVIQLIRILPQRVKGVLIANLRIIKTRSTKGNYCLWGSFKGKMCVIVPDSTHIFTIAKKREMFFILQIMQVTKVEMTISSRLPISFFDSQDVGTKSKPRDNTLHSPTQIKIKAEEALPVSNKKKEADWLKRAMSPLHHKALNQEVPMGIWRVQPVSYWKQPAPEPGCEKYD